MSADTYVVLGMHKSGTTLVAKILHRSGIEMDEKAEPDGDYDRGEFYERRDFKALNVEILGSGVPAYHDPTPRNLRLTSEQSHRMQALIQRVESRDRPWGFKDPRTCLTYSLWEPELPPHKLILVYRAPSEVWGHLSRHSSRAYHAWAALRSWCDHNRALIALAEAAHRDVLILSFENLMNGNQDFERLQRFVGSPLEDLREPGRYRIRTRGGASFSIASTLRRCLGRDDAIAIFRRLEDLRADQQRTDVKTGDRAQSPFAT